MRAHVLGLLLSGLLLAAPAAGRETVRVEWVQRLRDVQAFPSREALVAQLERDRQAARASLNR